MKLVEEKGAVMRNSSKRSVKKSRREDSIKCDQHDSHLADTLLLDRLDDIHNDIKELQTDVRTLQDDMLRHRTGAKVIVAVGSALLMCATWLFTQYTSLFRHLV